MVQSGFIKYKGDTDAITTGVQVLAKEESASSAALEVREPKADASTQTEEVMLISVLKELKERDELTWALDTIQQNFEEFSQNNLTLAQRDASKEEGIKSYMSTKEAMLLYKQSKPEN